MEGAVSHALACGGGGDGGNPSGWTAVANSTFGTGSFDSIYAIAYGSNRFAAGGARTTMPSCTEF